MTELAQPLEDSSTATVTRAPLRVMQALYCLALNSQGLSLAALSDMMKVPKTSLLTLLRTLESGGYVTQEDGLHRLGASTLQLASIISNANGFPENVRPVLARLQRDCRQTVMVGVPGSQWTELVYVDVLEENDWLSFRAKVGSRRPIYASAGGLALLAFAPDEDRKRYIATAKLEPLTAETIVTRAELTEALERFRRQAFAVGTGSIEGATGISAPVFDGMGRVAAAVVMAGVSDVMRRAMRTNVALLQRAAAEMSAVLGYTKTWPPA